MQFENPFEYKTPDSSTAEEIIELFVSVFGDFNQIPRAGHTIIHGPRGSGKSMIFRYMSPDCISLDKKLNYNELPYFSFYIPIKEGILDITELENLKNGENLINEHMMVLNFVLKIFESLKNLNFENNKKNLNSLKRAFNSGIKPLANKYGANIDIELDEDTLHECFKLILDVFDSINTDFMYNFIHKKNIAGNDINYTGPIFLFGDFLGEVLNILKELDFMPSKPFYLLIDDADNLNFTQTKILNTWISRRTTKDLCIKISTQLKYKTYLTVNNLRITTPHDYTEVNLCEQYTANKGNYKKRLKEIIQKRLGKYGYRNSPEDFFPKNDAQSSALKKIFDKYNKEYNYDYAYRYATSDYLKSLTGNRYTYSYAGFENLVNISSGVPRIFIEMASQMFDNQLAHENNKPIEYIKDSIQNDVVRKYSTFQYEKYFDFDDNFEVSLKSEPDYYTLLKNLVDTIGQIFNIQLYSEMRERRVFSFYIENQNMSKELKKVIKLGIEEGVFYKTFKLNKMGTGKMELFILNRVLAPHYQLDPSSFSGYKALETKKLEQAIYNSKPIVIYYKNKISNLDSIDDAQLSIFDNNE